MKFRKPILASGLLAAGTLIAGAAQAGGSLDTADITAGNVTVPGFIDGLIIPIKWDARCLPLKYTLDTTPPNFNTPAPDVDLATTRAELQASMEQWNAIRTSFIEMDITATRDIRGGVLTGPGVIGGFDFVNELNFVTQGGFLAAAPSVALIEDSTFVVGQDIDLDGDSDVFTPSGAHDNVCRDADGDGDIEFPAGTYTAGTILDNDVGFSATVGIPWNTTPDALLTTDIQAVAVHELGHSHGLSHSLINQLSKTNGEGATMFPFIDINDPGTESSQRTPALDDVAWSSYLYPENSAHSGPGALQPGDQGFDTKFGLVKGSVTSGRTGLPVAGANVWVQHPHNTTVSVSGYSGTTQLLLQRGPSGITDNDAGLFFGPNAAFSVLNGNYTIPVPAGDYIVGLQSLDGQPAATGNISLNAIVGGVFSDLNFREEFWNRELENGAETRPGHSFPVRVNNGGVTHVDFVTNVSNVLRRTDGNFDANDPFGFTLAPGGRLYAVRFPNANVQAFLGGTGVLHTGLFLTDVADASVPVNFASARLTTGSLNANGTASINLAAPLAIEAPFASQDTDFGTMFFKNPENLTQAVKNVLSLNPGTDLFMVLEVPAAPFPGVSNFAPLVGLDNDTVGSSFVSDDGGVTFNPQAGFNYFFELAARP